MVQTEIKEEMDSIVILGRWNPAIFHPSWFEKNNLIKASEADAAIKGLEVITGEFSRFRLPWVEISITRERLAFNCLVPEHFKQVSELAVGVLTLLRETPLRALGINKSRHVSVGNAENWHHFGHTVAPKEVFTDVLFKKDEEKPGLMALKIRTKRENFDYQDLTIEPSNKYPVSLHFSFNDHFQLNNKEEDSNEFSPKAIEIIESQAVRVIEADSNIIQQLLTKVYANN